MTKIEQAAKNYKKTMKELVEATRDEKEIIRKYTAAGKKVAMLRKKYIFQLGRFLTMRDGGQTRTV